MQIDSGRFASAAESGLATAKGFAQVEFREGRIERPPVADASADCIISNGVINLSHEKERVFAEAARILRPGGRLAIADIVSERQLRESIVCDADLWASCIGGAAEQGRLPGGDRGHGRAHRGSHEQPVQVHLGASTRREREGRREEHLAPGAKAAVTWLGTDA